MLQFVTKKVRRELNNALMYINIKPLRYQINWLQHQETLKRWDVNAIRSGFAIHLNIKSLPELKMV